MKKKILTIFFSVCCIASMGQTKYVPKPPKVEEQIGYTALEAKYGLSVFRYIFNVHNGLVAWTFTSSMGNGQGQFRCNRAVPGDIISSECSGVAYWNFACMFIWDMVEKHNKFDSLSYKWALEALESALKQLEKGKATSPGAYNRVNLTYTDIQKAEKGENQMSLWDTLCFYSAAMAENALDVSDLYDYDF